MAEGFEQPYHVPQQSRRDKLRVVAQSHPSLENLQGCSSLVSLFDPSVISPDLLTCAAGSSPSSASASHHMYMDPQTSTQLNPCSIQDINRNPYLCTTPEGLRFVDHRQAFHGDEIMVYKPEAFSFTHAANNSSDQGLSLSLSSSHPQQSNLPLELNLQGYDDGSSVTGGYVFSSIVGGDNGSTSIEFSRSSVSFGPFSGYASILKGSRFLKPAQHLLEELCDVGRGIYVERIGASDSAFMDSPLESFGGSGGTVDDDPQSCVGGGDGRRKSGLISMLHEVFRRYKQYYQHIQVVVASFESVAGLSNAAPFANLALKSMSKNFKSIKNAISDQLQFPNKAEQINYDNDKIPRFGYPYDQRPVRATSIVDHQPVWRPQRGLPERAVGRLRAWLFEHFLHPYPTDTDKLMLATQTGLSRNQVSNWFINARVRLWKPMVEEIHMLEMQQAQRASQRKEHNANRPNAHLSASSSLASENPSTSSPKAPDCPSKNIRNNMANTHVGSEQPTHLSYDAFLHHPHLAISTNTSGGSNVSLTLGLRQNIGIGSSDSFPINAARRLGLDANSEGYTVGGFEAQNRQCGRSIVGGQLAHGFSR